MTKFLVIGLIAFVGCIAIDKNVEDRQIAGFFLFALGFTCGMMNEIWNKHQESV